MAVTGDEIRALMARTWKVKGEDIPTEPELNGLLPWDSMGHVNLLLALEKDYGLVIDNDTVTRMISLKAIVAYLNDRG